MPTRKPEIIEAVQWTGDNDKEIESIPTVNHTRRRLAGYALEVSFGGAGHFTTLKRNHYLVWSSWFGLDVYSPTRYKEVFHD